MADVVSIPPGDPHWRGVNPDFKSTMGNDFWLAFMNNDMFDLQDPNNNGKRFELEVQISTMEAVNVAIAIGSGAPIAQISIPANTTYTYSIPSAYYSSVYLYNSESVYSQGGVHVYTLEDNKKFSCFSYSRAKETGGSSRDASLIIPTKYLGREYMVQTYPKSQDSNEFAIVATENGTNISITPSYATFNNTHAAGQTFTVTLNKGEAYLVASLGHEEQNFDVDLSGTTICSDKPIAVFTGNQATSIPFDESNSLDYLGEQLQPLNHWGSKFYLGQFESTTLNEAIVTAQLNNTSVTINPYYDAATDANIVKTVTLNSGQSFQWSMEDGYTENCVITASQPVEVYSYMTSAGENNIREKGQRYKFGDPANAMLPSWEHRVNQMNFFTKELDPQRTTDPQHFMLYLAIPDSDASKIVVDGTAVPATKFTTFDSDASMAYASIEVFGHGYHTVTSSGAGFVGIVYAVTAAQGWEYTLGYRPNPFDDSLFVTAPNDPMSPTFYHVTKASQGWYQRQLKEWEPGYERLDTVYVCEGVQVSWLAQLAKQNRVHPVTWYLYDITETGSVTPGMVPIAQYTDNAAMGAKQNYTWRYTFDLPDEKDMNPWEREPFRIYELHCVSTRNPILCPSDNQTRDTLRTTVHVNRVYNDTLYRIVCMGDSMRCFYDSVPHQYSPDLNTLTLSPSQLANRADSTLFIAEKTGPEASSDFKWKIRSGENVFTRHYQTRFGCDSVYTLSVFVCDTVRFVDTIYFCDNGFKRFNDTIYYGPKYEFPSGRAPKRSVLIRNNTVVEQHFKTKWCACSTNANYPEFEGCDSIYEIHIFLYSSKRDTLRKTVCASCTGQFEYRWPIQNGTDTLIINEQNPNLQWDARQQVWTGIFVDTMRTSNCTECNGGMGCDSICTLYLTVPKSYCFDTAVSLCHWEYDMETHQPVPAAYRWVNHREGQPYVDLTESGDYYDSCQTKRFGCDSVYHINVNFYEPYLKVETHSLANNQSFTWMGHNGNQTYGPYMEYKNDTVIHIYDMDASQTSDGCDSIVRLDLKIVPSFLSDTTIDLCVNKMTMWRGHRLVGKLYSGRLPSDTLYDVQSESYVLSDSMLMHTTPPLDSIYRLNLYVHPIYVNHDTVHVCDNSTFNWRNHVTYVGPKYSEAVAGGEQLVLGQDTFRYEYNFATVDECDSIWKVCVIVHPTYALDTADIVCQQATDTYYTWVGHGDADGFVYDEDGDRVYYNKILIPADVLPPAGVDYIFRDIARTQTCESCVPEGCDSIWTLRLHVNPRYEVTDPDQTICETEYIEWQGRIYAGDKAILPSGKVAYKVITQNSQDGHLVPTQDTAYVRYETVNGCDSIFHLHFTINPAYPVVPIVTERHICDVDTVMFHGDAFYGDKSALRGSELGHPARADYYQLNKMCATTLGCDSAVEWHIFVHKTYSLTDKIDTVCQGDDYEWAGHTESISGQTRSYWISELSQRKAYNQLPVNIPGTYTLVDSLKTTDCSECKLHGCDSVWTKVIIVGEKYVKPELATICEGETYLWSGGGDTVVMGNIVSRTENLPLGPTQYLSKNYTKHYTSQLGCDSVHTLALTVIPKKYAEYKKFFQTGDEPFDWNGRHYEFDHVYKDTFDYWVSRDKLSGCDSLVRLIITVDSAFIMLEDSFICQNDAFTWNGHPAQRTHVYHQGQPVNFYNTSVAGNFLYIDSLKSRSNTDSIYKLTLHVQPVYRHDTTVCICDNDYIIWQDSVFAGCLAVLPPSLTATRRFTAGTTNHFVNHPTTVGCDSTFSLSLTVMPTHLTLAPDDTTFVHICESKSYYFASKDTTYQWSTPDNVISRFVLTDTIPTFIKCDGQQGCDSSVVHVVYVHPEYQFEESKAYCQHPTAQYVWAGHHSSSYYWVEGHRRVQSISLAHAGNFTYIDSLKTQTCADCRDGVGCDSVWTLRLRVDSVYHRSDTLTMSDEETRKWEHTIYIGAIVNSDTLSAAWFEPETSLGMAIPQVVRIPKNQVVNDFDTLYHTIHGCDSLISLHLLVGTTFRDTIVRYTCDNEPYHWYHQGDSREVKPGVIKQTPQLYYDSLRTAGFGFDSIYVLDLRNNPTYTFYVQDTVCQGTSYLWPGHTESTSFYLQNTHRWISFDAIPTGVATTLTIIDSLKTKDYVLGPGQEVRGGCDSVYVLTLLIPPSYHFYETRTICSNDTVQWQDSVIAGNLFVGTDLVERRATLPAGEYDFNINYGTHLSDHSTFSCDSIYSLHLIINAAQTAVPADDTTRVSICDNETYRFRDALTDTIYNTDKSWKTGDHLVHRYVLTGLDTTRLGCDSAVAHVVTVYPTYSYLQDTIVCQDTVNTEWSWTDEFGGDHSNIHISLRYPGDYIYADTLLTIHGCDSVFGIRVHVPPIYRFDSTYTICDNESTTWQGRSYSGLSHGVYHDVAQYTTFEGCDSTYYLTLVVNATYDITSKRTACSNEDYVWYQQDHNGTYADSIWWHIPNDTTFLSAEEALLPQPFKATASRHYDRMLESVYGCDSMSRLDLTVYPTYFFQTDTSVCSNESMFYRSKRFYGHDTIYTEFLHTVNGCDSIYRLNLHVKPAYEYHIYTEICDNDTLYHQGSVYKYIVWKPGDYIPGADDYIRERFFTEEFCDSDYIYHVKVHPTYFFPESDRACSDQSHMFHNWRQAFTPVVYDVNRFVQSIDTTIVDSFTTQYGCDSVYQLQLHIDPSYHNIAYDTICDDGELLWRNKTIRGSMYGDVLGNGLPAGDYVIWDSLQTHQVCGSEVHSCDSIYELRLSVKQTYFYELHETICADECYNFNGQEVNQAGFYTDSLTTSFGCDSVYHLYLTVLDTTMEVIFDTICYPETYLLHGVPYSETGFYKDTTINADGCHHFTYLYLKVIPPLYPTAWPATVCADNNSYELLFTYYKDIDTRDPVSYSIYYDSLGHAQGFRDIVDEPIRVPLSDTTALLVPMPDPSSDSRQYPRPDRYPITLVLDNNVCTSLDSCTTDTAITINYPSWITEQRFWDVIGILSYKYNGWYDFDRYQWYRNDSLLIGETHEYLYVPGGLDIINASYYVRLHRAGDPDDEDYQTCPIQIYQDPIHKDEPTLDYLSVVPTYVVRDNAVVSILSKKPGQYWVYSEAGDAIMSGTFQPDVTKVKLPPVQGAYIFRLESPETIVEPSRRIIVIVGP